MSGRFCGKYSHGSCIHDDEGFYNTIGVSHTRVRGLACAI